MLKNIAELGGELSVTLRTLSSCLNTVAPVLIAPRRKTEEEIPPISAEKEEEKEEEEVEEEEVNDKKRH